ncbi:MAG TPA: beta-L-arabinofuranosidase domain-containing protein [Solirubrobacteraceae bacterium]|nr:beta-L-arabinofuranosidase domain-containing protein [Solirubrobacteraceae bacterium]
MSRETTGAARAERHPAPQGGTGHAGPVEPTASARARVRPVGAGDAVIHGGFWGRRQQLNRDVSLPIGARRLRDAGNLDDLRLAQQPGDHSAAYRGPRFMDSDIYKWLEAVAWELGRRPDPELSAQLHEWTGAIADAQDEDGYINSWVQASGDRSRRYRDLSMSHELYCMGHLLQAAVAAHRAAGDDELLAVARRAADHLVATFGPDADPGLDGHPVIEMALAELARETGEAEYLRLARHFVLSRGRGTIEGHGRLPIYYSDRVPVTEATHLEGHAVRALYLASGVADVALELPDADGEAAASLASSQERQWEDTVASRTYLTGGFGSRWDGEAFGDAFELPPDRAYCETCAAIAAVQWSWRRLLATGDPRHADLIERILFNGFASGTSLEGDEFFYVNALRVRAGAVADDHRNPAAGRHGWYTVACCPPNVMRTIAQLSGYLATHDDGGVQLQQYASGALAAALPGGEVTLQVTTDYPWDGRVEIEIRTAPVEEWSLDLRVPAWCDGASATVHLGGNGGRDRVPGEAGTYLGLRRRWAAGDRVVLQLPMAVRITRPDERIDAVRGCAAVEVGPLVYCFEDHDQPEGVGVDEIVLSGERASVSWRPELLGGVAVVELDGGALAGGTGSVPYRDAETPSAHTPTRLTAVPYHAWANRGVRAMRVWVPLAGGGAS